MFSIDVEDQYYSIPHDELMNSVKRCVTEENDEMDFINSCGVAVSAFLGILYLYLKSTFVEWDQLKYAQ